MSPSKKEIHTDPERPTPEELIEQYGQILTHINAIISPDDVRHIDPEFYKQSLLVLIWTLLKYQPASVHDSFSPHLRDLGPFVIRTTPTPDRRSRIFLYLASPISTIKSIPFPTPVRKITVLEKEINEIELDFPSFKQLFLPQVVDMAVTVLKWHNAPVSDDQIDRKLEILVKSHEIFLRIRNELKTLRNIGSTKP